MHQLLSACVSAGLGLVALPFVTANVLPVAPESIYAGLRAPAEVWGACGWRTSESKVVRTFQRIRGDAETGEILSGGTSVLRCGTEDYGYRHILKGHRGDWEYDARIVGSNWRDHADWSIDVVLTDPDVVTYRPSRNSYCYSRLIELWDRNDRRHVRDRVIKVVVRSDSTDIVTAYPATKQCKSNDPG